MKKYHIKYSAAALRDLSEISRYIAITLENPHAAAKVVDKIQHRCNSLALFPKAAPVRKLNSTHSLRAVHSGRYMIFYRLSEDERLVLITSVIFSPHLK